MKCVTNKRCFETQAMAEQALIDHRSRHYHNDNSGPINVYLCRDCDHYHFTSQGKKSEVLSDHQSNIDHLREANHWERKLR